MDFTQYFCGVRELCAVLWGRRGLCRHRPPDLQHVVDKLERKLKAAERQRQAAESW